jgi:hypothetical protein
VTRARGALLLSLGVLLGCAASGADPAPGAGRPLPRTHAPRAGDFGFEVLGTARAGGQLKVDLRIHNGTSHDYGLVAVQVIAVGPRGERAERHQPIGPLRRGTSRRTRAYLDDPGFEVVEILVELLYAQP